jgi:peptide subunit release factor 1 (eRF1)
MALTAHQRHTLKKFVKELSGYRGRHTELVTVYIPQGYDINKIINHLQQEAGTASNIKSTSTRKNVEAALEKMIQHLRIYKRTPEHGLAAFSGNVAEREGQSDVKVWSIEPPIPVKTRLYRCDKEFVLDVLEGLLDVKDVYGLVVMDKRDATIALLKGKTIVPLVKTHSEVPGKYRTGGQCCDPNTLVKINHDKEIKLSEIKEGDELLSYDFKNNKTVKAKILHKWSTEKDVLYKINVNGNLVSSSADHLFFVKQDGEVKEFAAEDLQVNDVLMNVNGSAQYNEVKIKGIEKINGGHSLMDIEVDNKNFIANGVIVHNSALRFEKNRELAAKQHYKKVADYMKDQFLSLEGLKGVIVGGPGPTKFELVDGNFITTEIKNKIIAVKDITYTDEFGLNELLERSEDVLAKEEVLEEKQVMNRFLETLAKEPKKTSYGMVQVKQVLEGGVVDVLLLSEALEDEIIDEFEGIAQQFGTDVKIISLETREGQQLKDLGKVAAILRYEVHG